MLSAIYNTIYGAVSGGIVGLQLLNLSPAPATLTEIVHNDRIQNPGIARVPQTSTNLESFLTAQYVKGPDIEIIKESVQHQIKIPYYHSREIEVLKEGKPTIMEGIFLESNLVYITATDVNAKRVHIIFDYPVNSGLQYSVVLPEGGSVATVIDPYGKFDEARFKKKIRIHLQKKW